LLTFAVGLGLTALLVGPSTNPWSLTPVLLLSGIGIGCVFAPMSTVTMSTMDYRLIGTASGVFSTARQIGGVLGTAAVGMLLQARITASIAERTARAVGTLPVGLRLPAAAAIARSAASAGGLDGIPDQPVTGLPPAIAAHVRALAHGVVRDALIDAARTSLLLPVGVLLLGALAAIMLRTAEPEPPAREVPVTSSPRGAPLAFRRLR
jgi:MFS family permease